MRLVSCRGDDDHRWLTQYHRSERMVRELERESVHQEQLDGSREKWQR